MSPRSFERAVVGDDGQVGGDCALAAAAFLQAKLGTHPHVVHSIDIPVVACGTHPEELVAVRADLAQKAEAWLGQRVQARLGSSAEYRVELGRPATALVRAARSLPAEMMVIGPHGQGGLLDFGGTQRSVFGNGLAHVWSQPTTDVAVGRVLVPFDFSDGSEEVMGLGLTLAQALSVPLVAMHCNEAVGFVDPMPAYVGDAGMPTYVLDAMRDAAKQRFTTWFEEFAWGDTDVESRFVQGEPALSILEEQRPDDIVVMGTHGHTGIAAALLGGVAYRVLKGHRSAVLAVRVRGGRVRSVTK